MVPTFTTIAYSPVRSFSLRLGLFSLKNCDQTATQSSPNFFGDCSQSGLEKIDWTVLRSGPNFFGDCTTVWSQNSRPDRTKISPVQSGPGPTVRSGQSIQTLQGLSGSFVGFGSPPGTSGTSPLSSGHPKGPKTISYGLLGGPGGPGGSGLTLGTLIGSGWLRLAPAAGLHSCAQSQQFWLWLGNWV